METFKCFYKQKLWKWIYFIEVYALHLSKKLFSVYLKEKVCDVLFKKSSFFFPKPILVLKSFLFIIFQFLNGSQKQHLWYVHVMSFFVFVSFILQVRLDMFYLGYWHTCHYFMSYSAITNTLVVLSNYQITIYWYMFLFGLHVCQQYVASLHMYTNLYSCAALLYQINQKIRFWQWKTIYICTTSLF